MQQFQILGDVEFLFRCLQHIEEAKANGEEHRGTRLWEDIAPLGTFWAMVPAIVTPEGDPLDRAIEGLRQGRSGFLHMEGALDFNLGFYLQRRWVAGKQRFEDLEEAIALMYRVLERSEMESDLEKAAEARRCLAGFLHLRYQETGDDEDYQRIVPLALEALRTPAAKLSTRIEAGSTAMRRLCEQGDMSGAHKLIWEVLELLLMLNGRSLGWQDKQYRLQDYSRFSMFFAAIAIESGSNVLDVIDILETCRGLILGHFIDKQSDIDDLETAAPTIAQRFRTLQNKVHADVDSSGNMRSRILQSTGKIRAEGEFRDCLAEIRKLEGFSKFLLGRTQEELHAAAARGPIVIVNLTSFRSDAILITKDHCVFLPLPSLEYERAERYLQADLTNFSLLDVGTKNRKYRKLLEWLWDNYVKLILDKLDNLAGSPRKRHVWWIGTGISSILPFHAAGKYTQTGKIVETALSRAISSYTPTLKVLIHGQRKLSKHTAEQDVQSMTRKLTSLKLKPRLAIVTMPTTPDMEILPGVQREAEKVLQIVRDTFSAQILVQPNAKDALAHMAECEIVHFACHGESVRRDPSGSHLVLQTTTIDSATPVVDNLRLRNVAGSNKSTGKLAFLSACSTAQNGYALLADEVLHLASGFQVAGYLHAIGNLWPSEDKMSVEIVTRFYKHLVAAGELGDGENVAEALNKALIEVSRAYPLLPLYWAQYIHFGVC